MNTPRVVYLVSALAHAALGTAVAAVRPPPVRETVTVTVREVRRPRAPTPPPPAPTPPPPAATPVPAAAVAPTPAPPTPARARPARAQAPRPAAPPPAPSAAPPGPPGPPDFGLSLGNGGGNGPSVGGGGGGGGGSPRAEAPAPARPASDGCDEAPARPRVLEMPEPEYPDGARDEGIEGRVRVELSLDDEGHVSGARVLQGLGHGLDEAALAAARGARFEPATRCGRAVATTFTLSVRFTL